MNFVVTSLSTGEPVIGAQVNVEGRYYNDADDVWKPFISGITDGTGQFRYGHTKCLEVVYAALWSVTREMADTHPAKPPPHFLDNHWYSSAGRWLSWLMQPPRDAKDKPVRKAHIFTERPVYRPEEPVHIRDIYGCAIWVASHITANMRSRPIEVCGRWTGGKNVDIPGHPYGDWEFLSQI